MARRANDAQSTFDRGSIFEGKTFKYLRTNSKVSSFLLDKVVLHAAIVEYGGPGTVVTVF